MANLTVHELSLDLAFEAPNHRDLMHEEIAQRLGGAGFYSPPPPLGSGSDDRARLITWLASVPANAHIGFPGGHLLSAPLPLPDGHRYTGRGVAEQGNPFHFKLLNGANPAAAETAVLVSKSWNDNVAAGGVPTIYENLAIDCNSANNTGTYSGLLPFSFWSRVRWCRIDLPRLNHVLYTKETANGTTSTQDHADHRVYGNRFREALTGTDGAAIRQRQPGGQANHHADVRVFDNHMESVQHGIWADSAAGWTLFDNHIWARRHGINVDNGFYAAQCALNYIDAFGVENAASTYYGIRLRGFDGNGATVLGNQVNGADAVTQGTHNFYFLEGINANAHIAGGLNRAFPNVSYAGNHGFIYSGWNGIVYNGQIGNLALGFPAGQDFEATTGGGGTLLLLYPRPIQATATVDWASMAAGASVTNTFTLTGAAVGDPCVASLSTLTTAGSISISARVTAANTVSVTIRNDTGSAVDPASGTMRIILWKTTA